MSTANNKKRGQISIIRLRGLGQPMIEISENAHAEKQREHQLLFLNHPKVSKFRKQEESRCAFYCMSCRRLPDSIAKIAIISEIEKDSGWVMLTATFVGIVFRREGKRKTVSGA